jgi:hypothetical protein
VTRQPRQDGLRRLREAPGPANFGQLLRHITYQRRRIGVTQQRRHGAHGEAGAAERFQLEAEIFQRRQALCQQRRRLRPDIDDRRHQQPLAGDAAVGVRAPQSFEGDTLVCRMLVDNQQ